MNNVVSYESPNSSDNRERHLQSGGVVVIRSKRVTITDSVMENPQHRGDGGNGYLFEVSQSSEVLFSDCIARKGRHNFIQNWDFGTSGIVWLRVASGTGTAVYSSDFEWLSWTAYSEFHHSLAMANLIDQSIAVEGWEAVNRQSYSSGAGHTATQSVFWNLSGPGALTSYQYGKGYVIGTDGPSVHTNGLGILNSAGAAPDDYTEGIGDGASLSPASLYEDQLQKRFDRGEALW